MLQEEWEKTASPHHTPCWQTAPSRWWRLKGQQCSQLAICSSWIAPSQSGSPKDRTNIVKKWFNSGKLKVAVNVIWANAFHSGSVYLDSEVNRENDEANHLEALSEAARRLPRWGAKSGVWGDRQRGGTLHKGQQQHHCNCQAQAPETRIRWVSGWTKGFRGTEIMV